jgi:hypothetical protein
LLEGDSEDYELVLNSSSQRYEKGSQVFLSYGHLSNRELLRRYGLVIQQNIYDYIFIKLISFPEGSAPHKESLLREVFREDSTVDVGKKKFKLKWSSLSVSITVIKRCSHTLRLSPAMPQLL